MTRELRLTVRLSPNAINRIKLRAEELGISSAEYLRAVVENDLRRGGDADTLARMNTEITLVSGMMLREWLTYALGKDRAKSLEDWANGRASGVIQEALRERSVDP
jgi:hypothetical protein